MAESSNEGRWWQWMLLPIAVVVAATLVAALGAGIYLLVFDLACPSTDRLDSACYSGGFLLLERGSFLVVAGLTGLAAIWAGFRVAPSGKFLAAQWLALLLSLVAILMCLALDWGMWPIYGSFVVGTLLALWLLRKRA
ncbi:MAG: hypothetical protein V7707_09070 [Motiliproteus sp.]